MSFKESTWHYDYPRLAYDSGFSFEGGGICKSSLKNIGHLDIEQIIQDRDIITVEKYIPLIVQFTLDSDQKSILDPNFVKLFCMSQFSVQYLLFCKKYLDNTVVVLKKELLKNNVELKEAKEFASGLQINFDNARKKIKELKHSMNCAHDVPVFQCPECPKTFLSEEYLAAHLCRRHQRQLSPFQVETDKLQLEIKELKQRLNTTEQLIHKDELPQPSKSVDHKLFETQLASDLQHKFEVLKVQIENQFKLLQNHQFDANKFDQYFEQFMAKLSDNVSHGGNKQQQSSVVKINRDTQTEVNTTRSQGIQTVTEEMKVESTQTTFELMASQNTTPVKQLMLQDVKSPKPIPRNRRKINEDMRSEAQQQMQRIEHQLERKMSSTIGKLENQIQTFLDKVTQDDKKRKIASPAHTFIVDDPKVVSPKIDPEMSPIVQKRARSSPKIMLHSSPAKTKQVDYDDTTESSEYSDLLARHKLNARPTNRSTTIKHSRKISSKPPQQDHDNILVDLENKMNAELQTLGVSPDWRGLPTNSFKRAVATLHQETENIKKVLPNFLESRKLIEKQVEFQVSQLSFDKSKSHKKSKLKSFFTTFRKKNLPPEDGNDYSIDQEYFKRGLKLTQPHEVEVLMQPKEDTEILTEESSSDTPEPKKKFANVIVEMENKMRHRIIPAHSNEGAAAANEDKTLPRKKVLFDLENTSKLKSAESTTTLNSSVLDGSKIRENDKRDLVFDFDI